MAKFFDEDYNEVEAFSKEEVDAKIADAVKAETKKFDGFISKDDVSKSYVSKEDHDKLSAKLTKRSEEYNNLKKKHDEIEAKTVDEAAEKTKAFEKMRDEMITKVAGDDKEYSEALRKQFDRLGNETTDESAIESTMKEAHMLAQTSLNRESTEFSIPTVAGGAPEQKPSDEADKPTAGEMAFLNRFR